MLFLKEPNLNIDVHSILYIFIISFLQTLWIIHVYIFIIILFSLQIIKQHFLLCVNIY